MKGERKLGKLENTESSREFRVIWDDIFMRGKSDFRGRVW